MKQATIVAVNDPDQQPWIDWIKEAIEDPDPDRLEDSGDPALQQVVIDAKDDGIHVSSRLNAKGRSSDFIKGRETFALILLNFKTTSNVEVLCTSMRPLRG